MTAQVRRTLERLVVMDHGDAIARQPHIEFQSVRAERKAPIERNDGVFGRQRRSATMRKDEWTLGEEERVTHGTCPESNVL
jgi:hypothetical protein